MRIGIDNYGLHPLRLDPIEALKWARANGAEGVQFSGLEPEVQKKVNKDYLMDIALYAESNGMYIEWGGGQHSPYDTVSWKKRDVFKINRKAAQEASILGARIIRSCSGGLMRWQPDSPMTETLLQKTAEALRSQRQMLEDYNVILAIETHFEFTTHELIRLFELCDAEPGGVLGICLDTMNLLTMLEDPVRATERILPWVVCTHMKDGGLLLNSDGFVSFPTEIGQGVVRLQKIIWRLADLPWNVNLSIEDHGGDFSLPIFDSLFLSKFPDLTAEELSRLFELALESREKREKGSCTMTKREEWMEVCEGRIKRDIRAVRGLVEGVRK